MATTDRDSRRDEDGARGAARFLARPLILAAIVLVLVVAFSVFLRGEPDRELPAELSPGAGGAGTEPAGVVEQGAGSTQQAVDPAEVIDNSSSTDTRPNILDAGQAPNPAATQETDVPDRVEQEAPAPAQD